MIELDFLKNRKALELLEKYSGKNPYLKKMKADYLKTKRISLTENQVKYIIDFHDSDPQLINKVVNISPYLGEELKIKEQISFVPERILIEFMLADTEKAFHVYGKLTRNQEKSKMYWLPKTMVLDDPYFNEIDVNVDFEKYIQLDSKGRKPYAHQEEGIKFLLGRDGCILADDMGLGKTYMSIVAALESGAEKILIVCPSAVKINWEREIKCFIDQVSIVNGRNWKYNKFVIINYDILKNFHTLGEEEKLKKEDPTIVFNRQLVNGKFDLVIIDEAHNLKNHKSIRGEIMTDLCVKHNIPKVWLLSGTPVANRPMDYYNLLKLIKSPIVDNWKFYATRYCEGRQITQTDRFGKKKKIWLTNGASNLEELALRTKNIMLMRKKHEVLDMPDKTISTIFHELDSNGWNEYNNLWEEYLIERKNKKKKGKVERDMVELILLRKFIAMEAIPKTYEMVMDAVEQGHKVIVFTTFTDELEELANKFGKICVVHNGPMTDKAKQVSIDKFQEDDKIKVFIGNIKSAGVGITLTAGDIVIFNSFDWVPGNNEQAEDRAYRIGQKNNVSVYYQLFDDTVTTRMWNTLKHKQEIIDTIMGVETYNEEEIIERFMDVLIEENE